MAMQLKANAGTCRSILTRKIVLKLPQTQLWWLHKGSLDIQSRYRSNRGFSITAEAAGFPVSYESFDRNNGGENKMMSSGVILSDGGNNFKEVEVMQIKSLDIGDGNNGQGGHGGKGNNGGGDANSGGYRYEDGHTNAVLLWILQWIRILRTSSAMWGGGGAHELLWLAEKAVEFLAANLAMSTGLSGSLIVPSLFAVTELFVMMSLLLSYIIMDMTAALAVAFSAMFGAFVTLVAGLSWAALSWNSLWPGSAEFTDIIDNIDVDFTGEE